MHIYVIFLVLCLCIIYDNIFDERLYYLQYKLDLVLLQDFGTRLYSIASHKKCKRVTLNFSKDTSQHGVI
jgi:hypothetical protein